MDILKKIYESNKSGGGGIFGGGGGGSGDGANNHFRPKLPRFGDEFRKPVWYDECETDDELYDNNKLGSGGGSAQQKAFGFQVFTNPLEMQKHFEQQVDEVMRSLHQYEDSTIFNDNARDNYLKPGFEDLFAAGAANDAAAAAAAAARSPNGAAVVPYAAPPPAAGLDTDLDGEIYADQLHSLLQRISPDLEALLPRLEHRKLAQAMQRNGVRGAAAPAEAGAASAPTVSTDEQRIFDVLHGTAAPDADAQPPGWRNGGGGGGKRPAAKSAGSSALARNGGGGGGAGGIFEGVFQGPKIFRQSIMTSTMRRPDGSTETRRIVRDADGTTSTTVTTTTPDGRTETVNSKTAAAGGGCGFGTKPPPGGLPGDGSDAANGGGGVGGGGSVGSGSLGLAAADRNIYVTKEGYAMPMNIW